MQRLWVLTDARKVWVLFSDRCLNLQCSEPLGELISVLWSSAHLGEGWRPLEFREVWSDHPRSPRHRTWCSLDSNSQSSESDKCQFTLSSCPCLEQLPKHTAHKMCSTKANVLSHHVHCVPGRHCNNPRELTHCLDHGRKGCFSLPSKLYQKLRYFNILKWTELFQRLSIILSRIY